jgi:uncharacterized protein with beta-barrel porin domain
MKSLLITKAFFIAAVSLARAGTMTDLGTLPGGNYATANSLSAEWIHRFDQADAAMTVTDITSTLSFSMPSADPTRDQARIGLDVDHKLDDLTTLSVTVHAAGVGESPDVSGALSLRRAF